MQGTIRELVAKGICINGVKLDEAMLSVIVRCGIGSVVGDGPKPARGRTPKIYQFNKIEEITFMVSNG